jgi:hypothetical protein
MKVTDEGASPFPDWRRTMFYRVELFQAGERTGIEFFDPHEFAEAKQRALDCVENGSAERSEVRDDTGALAFAYRVKSD